LAAFLHALGLAFILLELAEDGILNFAEKVTIVFLLLEAIKSGAFFLALRRGLFLLSLSI